jgi:hypothetical protein
MVWSSERLRSERYSAKKKREALKGGGGGPFGLMALSFFPIVRGSLSLR